MAYKVTLYVIFLFVSCLNVKAQRSGCDYSIQDNSNELPKSEACVLNNMYSYSSVDTAAKKIIAKILNLISLPVNFAVEPCDGINTCRAFVYDNGVRYVFYDRHFIQRLINNNQNEWELISILAHELGHHLCGHTLISCNSEAHRNNELEADQFSGAMLARMGAKENQTWKALSSVSHPACDKEVYNSYPCFEHRKEAILRGFHSVSDVEVKKTFKLNKDLQKVDISSQLIPVKNQGNDATCVGFSISYALEYAIGVKYNYYTQISPRYIYNSIGGTEYSGAKIEDALEFLKKTGAVEESVWPYKPGDYNNSIPKHNADTTSNRYKIKDYFKLDSITVEGLKDILISQKAIIIAVEVFENFFTASDGIWKYSISDRRAGVTSICLVGFDEDKKLFKFKNSWGEDWGDKGYGYIRYEDITKLIDIAYYIEL